MQRRLFAAWECHNLAEHLQLCIHLSLDQGFQPELVCQCQRSYTAKEEVQQDFALCWSSVLGALLAVLPPCVVGTGQNSKP